MPIINGWYFPSDDPRRMFPPAGKIRIMRLTDKFGHFRGGRLGRIHEWGWVCNGPHPFPMPQNDYATSQNSRTQDEAFRSAERHALIWHGVKL